LRPLLWNTALVGIAILSLIPGAEGQFAVTKIKSFCSEDQIGSTPFARLLQGTDGALYGTTLLGGGALEGTVFKLNRDGSGYRVLHRFSEKRGDGAAPYADLIEASDGLLYGTTHLGGVTNLGTIFKLKRDGTGYTVLRSFTGAAGDAANPYAGLTEGTDGALYGTSHFGGVTNLGTVFKLSKDGSAYSVLHSFTSVGTDGVQPSSRVIEGSDGVLYGTTYFGGAANQGAIFRLNKDGSNYRVIRSLNGAAREGTRPYGALLEGSDGALYGTASLSGNTNLGAIFKLNKDGSGYRVLHDFTNSVTEGAQLYGSLIWGADGHLYGTTAFGGKTDQGTVFKLNKDGSGFGVIYHLSGGPSGASPYGGVIEGGDGALYGAANAGGNVGRGGVFKLAKDGSGFGLLHHFTDGEGSLKPYSKLLVARDGSLFGASWGGGNADLGTLFRLNRNGSDYRLLHVFTGPDADGAYPFADLIEGTDGALYGTTVRGGTANQGSVFKLNADGGGYRVIHSFTGVAGEGSQPYGALVEVGPGVLCGTTVSGGAGQGVVFRMNLDGTGYSVIRTFSGTGDGANPYGNLFKGSDGGLYGTTAYGGALNFGTVFRINSDGSNYRVLRSFTSAAGDGRYPFAPAIEASDGALYGMTVYGGTNDLGTIYQLSKDGTGYKMLWSFTDGAQPASNASLIEGPDGALYGTTSLGGSANAGTLFRFDKNRGTCQVLYNFLGTEDGLNPYAGLVKGSDGAFYGPTLNGGFTCGTIYKFAPTVSLAASASGELTVAGPAGFQVAIQAREDLGSPAPWQFIANLTLSANPSKLPISFTGTKARQFYRAELLP
jgi:uncharacterized repeat protein (TIGR03803 family)